MREKRTVIIGGGFVLAMLLLFKALPAFNKWRADVRATAESVAAERALAERAVSLRADYDDSLKVVTDRYMAMHTAVMEDESGADLAAILADAADGAGMRLGAVQITADTTVKNGLIFVSVRADITGDVRGVTTLLQTLESGTPIVRIDKLAISNTDPASPRERPENLRAEITVSGIVRAEES
jgi:hypothetical protein